ncbi:CDP-diacylglycerol--serine O-phosphatidyltransferase [Pedobacter yulinensis]|uniref:CDP-diacylglycerol--serine O-phosphatidyltransferase n=1 Tax=Pedobacter yulinensis TaxID=2126353 RepID=A0A2T3HM35_9SPHI|nr:CDP-diacylglycerol--serine O-phosphatidyltransferase [Pedobacter yulinensis]PST83500.1 CDP-diacylglycerol--serine O-phosphatidyltransferase [Pedobacter yulinensis]
MKKHIPNALTCANLAAGCVGIVLAFRGELQASAYCVLISGIFDFFDGFAARLLRVKSAIGKELDSLADMVSFGFLPGVVMFKLLGTSDFTSPLLPYFGFLITIFSALRLAKFNIDERQTEDFIGLNTPMNTLFIVSLPFIAADYPHLIGSTLLLLSIAVVCSLLLVSELRIFSLKMGSVSWKDNKFKYIFLLLSAVLLAVLQFAAVPFVLVLYLAFSLLHFRKKKRLA